MARDLGSDPLEVGAVKLDENFAGVLVRKTGGFDPTRLQMFPVALVKRGTEWTATPVPASFENSGTGYAVELRKRLELLENWMLREQVVDLEKLREQSARRMREKIEAKLSADDLRKMNSQQLVARFLKACEQRDLPSMLGFLGGLAPVLPDDWPNRLKAAERAVAAGAAAPRPWRLLASQDVARAVVSQETDSDGASISLGCLDPAGSGESAPPRVELVHLELRKADDGLWQINLPPPFLDPTHEQDEDEESDFDIELLDTFPAEWIKANPLKHQSSAAEAQKALIEALGSGKFPSLLAVSKIDAESEEAARNACVQAAKIGWTILNPAAVRHAVPLAFKAEESSAVGLFQFFSARDPDRFDPRALYFEKSANGWLWSPAPGLKLRENLQGWVDSETKVWRDQWQQLLLSESPPLTEMESLAAPTTEAARDAVEAWLQATRAGDVKAALLLTTRLDTPQSGSTVLQNMGYEIAGSKRGRESPEITGIYQGKTWTAVGVKIDQGEKSSHPLYPVTQTAQGPRILIEIDLFAAGNRGREFLNRTAIERLGKATTTAGELRDLYSQHQENVGKSAAERRKSVD